MNETPEKIVKRKCLLRLDQWQRWGIVVDIDDVSDLGRGMSLRTGRFFMHTKKGKRDLIAWFKVEDILWTYLIECKAPDGGTWSKSQQDYAQKFEGLTNCIYEVVKDEGQIDETLERITNRNKNVLNSATRHMTDKCKCYDYFIPGMAIPVLDVQMMICSKCKKQIIIEYFESGKIGIEEELF